MPSWRFTRTAPNTQAGRVLTWVRRGALFVVQA
jgi:hypothetical protein